MKPKIDSLMALGIAIAFQWFFMFTKHDPRLRPVIPFGDDPYDALGSFATIVDILLCLLLLWRTFRPSRGQSLSATQSQYLRRTQAAIPLLILVTLAADGVAMVRHPRMWIGVPSEDMLLVAFFAMAVASCSVLGLILSSAPQSAAPEWRSKMISSALAGVFLLILALYPERLINHLSTHLLTVLIGDLLLFVPVSILLRLLLPVATEPAGGTSQSRHAAAYVWIGMTLAGFAIGVALFVAEMTEGGGPMPPIRLRVVVALVYIALTVAGVLMAFGLLRRPLGLESRNAA